MKSRWMKSVIETSKQPMPALPFRRRGRGAATAKPATGAQRAAMVRRTA